MRLKRIRREREEAQIELTPMLDIVFIMLIFFIVTSTFARESGVEVNRPSAKNVSSQPATSIQVAITESNQIYVDNQRIDEERLDIVLKRYAAEQVNVSLIIQADAQAYSGSVITVLDAAKGAGIEQVAIAAEPNR